jgi:YVTN family beta-propeller protein
MDFTYTISTFLSLRDISSLNRRVSIMKKNRIVSFALSAFLLLSLLLAACSKDKNTSVYAVVLSNDKKNIAYLDNQFNIIQRQSLGLYLEDIKKNGNYLYAIDSGLAETPAKRLYRINLTDLSVSQLELPHIPHQFSINNNLAYISSSDEKKGSGFYLMLVDLNAFKLIDSAFTKGAVTSFAKMDKDMYVAINSGGASNYGSYSKIEKIETINNKVVFKNILNAKEELPPTDMYINNGTIYGVYSGFAYGPKPGWLKEPDKYTNKIKEISLKNGEVNNVYSLSSNFPQMVAVKNNIGFINHYSNLDMQGEFVTVFDLSKNKVINKIKTPTPVSLDADDKSLLVTNLVQGTLTVFDSNTFKEVKKVEVGKWPYKVIILKNN